MEGHSWYWGANETKSNVNCGYVATDVQFCVCTEDQTIFCSTMVQMLKAANVTQKFMMNTLKHCCTKCFIFFISSILDKLQTELHCSVIQVTDRKSFYEWHKSKRLALSYSHCCGFVNGLFFIHKMIYLFINIIEVLLIIWPIDISSPVVKDNCLKRQRTRSWMPSPCRLLLPTAINYRHSWTNTLQTRDHALETQQTASRLGGLYTHVNK